MKVDQFIQKLGLVIDFQDGAQRQRHLEFHKKVGYSWTVKTALKQQLNNTLYLGSFGSIITVGFQYSRWLSCTNPVSSIA